MSASARHTTSQPPHRHGPATVEALLDQEEALAIERITKTVQRMGEGVCSATDLRARIRRHPLLAAGIGACLGFAGGPLLLRALRKMLPAAMSAMRPANGAPRDWRSHVLASVRAARTH